MAWEIGAPRLNAPEKTILWTLFYTALYCKLYNIVYCILYCIVLYYTVLYIVLYCIVLYFIVLYCIVLYCIVLYRIVLCIIYRQSLKTIAIDCLCFHVHFQVNLVSKTCLHPRPIFERPLLGP